MAASRRQMNNRTVTFTPTSGSATTITGVTATALTMGGSTVKFSGDGDRFVTTLINDFTDPSLTITAADFSGITANPIGTYGTASYVSKDARNQAASSAAGDITVSLTGMISDIQLSSPHRQIGSGTLTVTGQSADGITSPVTLSIA